MQGIRDERIAKAEGVAILLLMAAVALVVHLWPRPAPAPRQDPPPRASEIVSVSAPVSTPASAPVRPPRRRHAPVRTPGVTTPNAPPSPSPDLVVISHLPGSDIDIRPTPPRSVTEPEAGPPDHARRPGAMTRAATSAGKALAGAFKKTGSAVRRVF